MTQHWRERAACRGMDTELFFAGPADSFTVNQAKRVCGTCPVAEECALFAIESRTQDGIWGGLGRNARDALANLIRTSAADTTQREAEAS